MFYILRVLFIALMITGFIFSQVNSSRGEATNKQSTPVNYQSDASILFVDDMNGLNTVAGLEARGWVVLNEDGGGTRPPFNQGDVAVFTAYEGPDSGYTFTNYQGANGFLIDQWLISPPIAVSAGDTLRFWHRSPDGNPWDDSIYVRYSTTAGITPAAFDQTWGRYLVSESGWAQWVGTFNHTGTIRFAIQYYITDGGPSGNHSNYVGLDLFEVAGVGGGSGYGLPEVLYYTFDETGSNQTTNYAVPGRGLPIAPVLGGLTMGPTGQFGSALIGAGGSGTTDYVNTGWATDIGTSDWTISMWMNDLNVGVTTLYYMFGESGAGSFRCFLNGVAGVNNIALRQTTPAWNIYIGPVAPGPSVVHFVYHSSVPEIRSYINGTLVSTTPVPALNITAAGPFKVGGYSTSAGMFAGSKMDEFRFYSRALDSAEVAATWNISIVPVELTSFTATVSGTNVSLLWETASELNNSGFSIERKYSNTEFMEVGFVPGFGTTSEPKSYSFIDNNLRSGVYSYRLKQIDFDGTFTYSDEVEVEVIAPVSFTLDQNYPNPFNPSTRISFSLAVDSKVSLKIFDILGQEVASLINQELTQGVHTYDFNAAGINSGVYFYKIEATGVNGSEFTDVKKMILIK